jgi:dTDP-4-dehydrorhamnose reductase
MAKPKILILGGTQLLGRDFIENSLSKEIFDITMANRGITNPDLFTNISHIKYDRNIDNTCSQFKNLAYDYVIDFSCYTLTQFLNTWKYLNFKQYVYISTMSVFDYRTMEQKDTQNLYYWYCINKKEIEDYIVKNLTNILIIRPVAIYGDNDYTNRFYKQNNQYYLRSTNLIVNNKEGYMFVKDFTKRLLECIDIDTTNTLKIMDILP